VSSLARLESGHTPSRSRPEYWGGDVPWIGIRDATGNHGRVIEDTEQHTNQLGIDNSSARVLPKDTVCLSRTASVGYVVVMGKPMATSQDFANWVCGDGLNPHFLKYILLAERETLHMYATGTTHQTIYYPELKAFHICAPDRKHQDAIAATLFSLDKKVENNRRMSERLERLARLLFKEWFVDFNPVRAKAEGRQPTGLSAELSSLFPDSLDEHGVPQGWRSAPLDQIADFLNGLALQKFPGTGIDDLPVIKIAELRSGVTPNSGRASKDIPVKYVVEDGDILFSWSGSLVQKIWTGGRGALNQHLFKVTSITFPKWFHYYWVEHHLPTFQAIAASKATTMGHIQRHHLTEAKVVIGSSEFMAAANRVFSPLYAQIVANDLESRKLCELRDALMPKLLAGEARVRDIERLVGTAT
jgi:type I restriction enzyme S subunit